MRIRNGMIGILISNLRSVRWGKVKTRMVFIYIYNLIVCLNRTLFNQLYILRQECTFLLVFYEIEYTLLAVTRTLVTNLQQIKWSFAKWDTLCLISFSHHLPCDRITPFNSSPQKRPHSMRRRRRHRIAQNAFRLRSARNTIRIVSLHFHWFITAYRCGAQHKNYVHHICAAHHHQACVRCGFFLCRPKSVMTSVSTTKNASSNRYEKVSRGALSNFSPMCAHMILIRYDENNSLTQNEPFMLHTIPYGQPRKA